MTLCCLIPRTGLDQFVGVKGHPAAIIHRGVIFHRTTFATHGGWPIYRQAKGEDHEPG